LLAAAHITRSASAPARFNTGLSLIENLVGDVRSRFRLALAELALQSAFFFAQGFKALTQRFVNDHVYLPVG
jgi:hypothetical protein